MVVRFLALCALAAFVTYSTASAAVDVTISDEFLDPSLEGGSFVIQLESDTGVQPLGAFDFNVRFTDFLGNLSGQSVTIDGVSASLGSTFGIGTTTMPVTLNEGDDIRLTGIFTPGSAVYGVSDFINVDFSLANPLQSGDFFTAEVFLRPTDPMEVVGIVGQNLNDVTGSVGSQVVGVPEPGGFIACGLIAAGVGFRRRPSGSHAA